MSKQNNWSLSFYQFLIFITLVCAFSLIIIELHYRNQIERSKFSYEINKSFENNGLFNSISIDISDNKKIFIENGGRWSEDNLNDYLGFFELLNDYAEAKSIDIRDVYDEFSDQIIAAYNNKEIQDYIKKSQKEDREYYENFLNLAIKFDRINKMHLK